MALIDRIQITLERTDLLDYLQNEDLLPATQDWSVVEASCNDETGEVTLVLTA